MSSDERRDALATLAEQGALTDEMVSMDMAMNQKMIEERKKQQTAPTTQGRKVRYFSPGQQQTSRRGDDNRLVRDPYGGVHTASSVAGNRAIPGNRGQDGPGR